MKIFKKLLTLFIIIIMMVATFINCFKNNVYASPNATLSDPVKVGVFLYRADDLFISLLKQNLENIQKENENKVEFTFYDGKGNQGTNYKFDNTGIVIHLPYFEYIKQ